MTAASAVVGCLGLLAVGGSGIAGTGQDPAATDQALNQLVTDRITEEDAVSRSLDRTSPSPSASPSVSPSPSANKVILPVAGLDKRQMGNAATIVAVAKDMGLSRRAMIIGVATALQESDLYNSASQAVPESLNYPHEGTSVDHDSIGIFQQRPSAGWGTVMNLMKPAYQARNFFRKLLKVSGWQNMSLTQAAQAVQVSAYPNAYAKHEKRATTIVDALL